MGWLVQAVSPVALPTGSVGWCGMVARLVWDGWCRSRASSRYDLFLRDLHDHFKCSPRQRYATWRRNMFCRLSILGSMVESSLSKDESSKRVASVRLF